MLTPFSNFSFSCKSNLTTKNEARLHPWVYLAVILMLLGLALADDTAVTIASNPPVLISNSTSTRAIAVESVTLAPEPFGLESSFGGLHQPTRVMIFAMNLTLGPGQDLSEVSAEAEDSAHRHYALSIEAIRAVPSYETLSAVVFKLNEALGDVGDVLVSVSFAGAKSNRVRVAIGHVGGGPPDDPGAVPTPALPYQISGRLVNSNGQGLGGIPLNLSGPQTATAVSEADGSYFFAVHSLGVYTLTPVSNIYYSFIPTTFTSSHLNETLNFTGTLRTYSISGRLVDQSGNATAGRTVNLTGAQTGTTLSDNNGEYQFAGLPPRFDYTVAPLTNPYFTYTPAQIFLDLQNNQVANFVGTQHYYSVSGWMQLGPYPAAFKQIPITGSISTSVTTDDLGRFSIDLPAGGNYTMTPSVTYYTFSPASLIFTDLTAPRYNLYIEGQRQAYEIRGKVKDQEDHGLSGLIVNLSGAELRTTVTDASGNYKFPTLYAGYDYTVTPQTTASHIFTGRNVNDLRSDQDLDFVGLRRLALTGRVKNPSGSGISGIKMTLAGTENAITTTAADGSYSFVATATGNYTLTPSIPQSLYNFAPANVQLNNLAEAQLLDFNGTLAPVPDPASVLEFDGQPKSVDYGNFWQQDVDLGHFYWEFWAMPGSNAGATYMLSDGYGGAHALLFGLTSFGQGESNRYEMLGNIFDGVKYDNYFASDMGPAVGEWAHLAVGWDGQNIITYFDGVPVGKLKFSGPRRTPGPGGGGGRLMIGGSDHSNFAGRIAQVRGYEGSNPRENSADGPEASFAPETVFGLDGNLVSRYFQSGGEQVADLSHGYNGINHNGSVRSTLAGVLGECPGCPLPQFVLDPSAPNFATNAAPSPIGVPSPSPVPNTALVFDSFSRPNSTYLFGSRGGLGSTEGGSAGMKVWRTNQSSASPQPFGILNARAVLLANTRAVAWVTTGSVTGDVDVRVAHYPGTWGSGRHSGLSFRVQDAENFFFVYTADSDENANLGLLRVGYYLNGQRMDLNNGAAIPDHWTTLQVVTNHSGLLEAYIDGSLIFSTTSPVLASANGAGLYNNSSGLGLVNRWDDFTVFNAQ